MKKFIAIIVAIVSVVFSANAQLTVKAKADAMQKVATVRVNYSHLYVDGLGYSIMFMSTTNQFDKGGYFHLGETKEDAIETAKDLIELCNQESGTGFDVEDAAGVEAFIHVGSMLGKPYLDIKTKGNAGTFNITPKELEKVIKALSN